MSKSRPYFSYRGEQIRQLFEENQGDATILKAILAELEQRSTPKMRALRSEVEQKLAASKCVPPAASKFPTTPVASTPTPNIVQPQPKPVQSSLFEEVSKPAAQPRPSVPPPSQPPPPHSRKTVTPKDPSPGREESRKEEPEPPRHERRMGTMRKPGKLTDVPAKMVFELKNDFKLELGKGASIAERYEACLKGLVAEMRRQKTGFKQVVLQGGIRMHLDGRENGYQFPYLEDAELFEGAAVIVVIGGTQSEGRIVSFLGNQVVISVKDDFGPRISTCVVKVDNTAMLEALRVRLEKVIKGEDTTFNMKMAEAVVCNVGDELPPAFVQEKFLNGLNACQRDAVAKIVGNIVFYLWGPPGTGKTKTLGALSHVLTADQKRILICSNTNQAVDQVLLKLCELFWRENRPALDDGRILRVGQPVLPELINNWSGYITLDGVVERKSQSLIERKNVLETKLEQINAQVTRAADLMAAFKLLDGLLAEKERNQASIYKKQSEHGSLVAQKHSLGEKLQSLTDEKRKIQGAGGLRRTFMRSIEKVEADIKGMEPALLKVEWETIRCGDDIKDLQTNASRLENTIVQENRKVAGVDRKQVEHQVERAEEQKRPISDEIADINKQLEDIRKSVMDRALVVGATVTKAYLSPQHFSSFDVVIVDEASMAMLPALFNAAGLAKEKVVISGDFRQLAPIVQTEQKVICETIGGDIFRAARIGKKGSKRVAMLTEQYRMDDQICRLISGRMYKGDLCTASSRRAATRRLPTPFDGPLTIVDTSSIWPFVNRDQFKSRYNLMNALAVRNLCRFFGSCDHLTDIDDGKKTHLVGVCTPYAAQSKVLRRVLEGADLQDVVDAGTVHRYQGDEKRVMIIDIPDSHGEKNAGIFLQADHLDDSGAMLFNVAVSRAKDHLIVFANICYLDQKLPNHAILRGILADMQGRGTVVDVLDVLSMYPVMEDLGKLGRPFNLSVDAEKFGLFDQNSFDEVCMVDMERAQKSIAIYSGFITEQRVARYEALFRGKVSDGVSVRCVTRPPKSNGSIPVEQGKAALDGLERFGCSVDTRGEIHEKVVIIDDEILWYGSLNALSHTNHTDEIMTRVEGKTLCLQMAAFLALDRGVKPESAEGVSSKAENPRCPECGARTSYRNGRYGPYWDCEECEWKESFGKAIRRRTVVDTDPDIPDQDTPPPKCEKCGLPMKLRSGRFGDFYGCTGYPTCTNKAKVN